MAKKIKVGGSVRIHGTHATVKTTVSNGRSTKSSTKTIRLK